MRISSKDEFDRYVEMVAENNLEKDGSSSEYVAESVVTDIAVAGKEATTTTTAEPYADQCIDPADVIRYTIGDANVDDMPDGFRAVAVDELAEHIKQAQMNIDVEDK